MNTKYLPSTLIMALCSKLNTKLGSILLFSVLTMAASLSMAGRGGGGGFEDVKFYVADLDRNRRLDRDEAKSVYNLADEKIFSRYDEDQNGLITRSEFMEFMQQSPWITNIRGRDDQN